MDDFDDADEPLRSKRTAAKELDTTIRQIDRLHERGFLGFVRIDNMVRVRGVNRLKRAPYSPIVSPNLKNQKEPA